MTVISPSEGVQYFAAGFEGLRGRQAYGCYCHWFEEQGGVSLTLSTVCAGCRRECLDFPNAKDLGEKTCVMTFVVAQQDVLKDAVPHTFFKVTAMIFVRPGMGAAPVQIADIDMPLVLKNRDLFAEALRQVRGCEEKGGDDEEDGCEDREGDEDHGDKGGSGKAQGMKGHEEVSTTPGNRAKKVK